MRLLAIGFLALLIFAVPARTDEWTEKSFEDFRDGTFTDAGSNAYVSARGRIQLINRWDLNNDGFLDIIMPAGHGQTEKEDTYLYLNNGGDIEGRTLIRVPANGSMDGIVRDFNKDGINDLAVCNGDNGIHQRTDTYVYYGTKDGFTAKSRVTLPSHNNTGICAGDFDGDGLLDLAIASRFQKAGLQEMDGAPECSFVYWNSPDGFKPENRTEFSFKDRGAQNVAAADLDGDGKDDLIMLADKTYIYYGKDGSAKDHSKAPVEIQTSGDDAAIGDVNKDGVKDLVLNQSNEVRVLLGKSGGGFDIDKPIMLKANRASDVSVADFDGDGMDDIAVSNFGSGNDAQQSFVYYSDGKDFTGREKTDLTTFGASTISAGDINGDGKPEIVISNQRINYYQAMQSAVFWNKGGKFSFANRTQLDTQGSTSNCIGDVNNDGKPDVVFFNLEGFFRDGPAYTRIYWGDGTRNSTPLRAFDIVPTHYVTGVAQADLDDDGDVELVINQGRYLNGLPYDNAVPTIICWNSPEGLTVRSNLTLDNPTGGGTKILDFNRDGYLDLLIGGTVKTDDGKSSMAIFLGSADGFHHNSKIIVLVPDMTAFRVPLAMDLNKDGFIDLAAQIKPGIVRVWYGTETGLTDARTVDIDLGRKDQLMYINAADLNKDGWLDMILPCRQIGHDSEVTSFIYFGQAEGFTNGRRIEVPTDGPYDLSVADFDKDGWLDVVMDSYKGNLTRNKPSYIYWGNENGLKQRPRSEFPTYASSGIETADFDGDGWIDIYSANHRKDGSTDKPGPHRHQTDSMVYWGGKTGFSPERRLLIPSYGPHPVNIRDVGNSYDRGLYEDYISSPHEIPAGQAPVEIRWQADTPLKTSVQFQVRVAATREALQSAQWVGPRGKEGWFGKSGLKIERTEGKWIQYCARLVTPNGGATPYLTSVTIVFK